MEALKQIKIGIIVIFTIIILSSISMSYVEGWDFFTALYVVIVTITTVGYGDYTPKTQLGKIITTIYIICGVGTMAYTIGAISGFFIEGRFKEILKVRKMRKQLEKIEDHYIICGFGRIGKVVATKFDEADVPYVVIDIEEDRIKKYMDNYKNMTYLVGDASSDNLLLKAKIKKAKGLVAAVDSDAENAFITLTAKENNPNIFVVAKADSDSSAEKLIKAGADRAVSPYNIGGLRIAEMTLKPEILDFVSTLLDTKEDMEIGRYTLRENSELIGKSLYECRLRQKTGVTILAIKKIKENGKEVLINPEPTTVFEEGDILYVFGTKEQLKKFKELTY